MLVTFNHDEKISLNSTNSFLKVDFFHMLYVGQPEFVFKMSWITGNTSEKAKFWTYHESDVKSTRNLKK